MIETGFQRPKYLECDYETLTKKYGRFSAQPFDRGYGITIGNALRRILLSSITGAAITAVRIQGVLHEFSSIPGVVEDVTDIILNLKGIRLRLEGEEPKIMTLKKKGPAEAKTSDIVHDPDIEILGDVVISAFEVLGDRVEHRYPGGTGEFGLSMCSIEVSKMTTAEIDAILSGAVVPNSGLVLVEIYYDYYMVLGLPWIRAFVPDPVRLHAYGIMPNVNVEPTPTP